MSSVWVPDNASELSVLCRFAGSLNCRFSAVALFSCDGEIVDVPHRSPERSRDAPVAPDDPGLGVRHTGDGCRSGERLVPSCPWTVHALVERAHGCALRCLPSWALPMPYGVLFRQRHRAALAPRPHQTAHEWVSSIPKNCAYSLPWADHALEPVPPPVARPTPVPGQSTR